MSSINYLPIYAISAKIEWRIVESSLFIIFITPICGAWVGTNRSLYMVQFRATNLLENLLDFHLEGVLLLQIEKCSMSSSIVAWEVPDDFVYFLIFFFACVRASQSHCWISSSHLSMSFLQSDRIIITSSVTTLCASACRNGPFWNNRGRRGWSQRRRGWSQGCRMISPQDPT